jgi:hypothetical protein
MSRKFFFLLLIVTGISLVFFFGRSQAIYSSAQRVQTGSKADDKLMITHTEVFGKLERFQVLFDHAKHSEAYKKEGCKTCHPPVDEQDLIFEYPFKPVKKDKESMKNSYHDKCITCHQKLINQKKKGGPVACGECHRKDNESLKIKHPVVEFDFSYHDKHVKKLKNNCILCHHSYDREDKELVYEKGTEQSCYYCHDTNVKKGPSLAVETGVINKKGLTMRKVSHENCVNCHLFYNSKGMKAGPLECSRCHTGKYKTVTELASVPRPDRDQPKKAFITIEDGKMKGVLFDHTFHEKNSRTCRACHHETLNVCRGCHGLTGSPEGKGINAANAFHDVFSEAGCAGCHKMKKSGRDCAGCHYHLLDMAPRAKGPKKAVCTVCHNGKKEGSDSIKPIAVAGLESEKVPEKVTIKILEKQYEPSIFPHRKIIRKLIEASNESKMATYFHRNMQTICEGCHHQSQAEAESRKGKPPFCRNCHEISFDLQNINRPRLLAAYHRQCLGCHEKMGLKQTACKDCHKEKAMQPKDILSKNG